MKLSLFVIGKTNQRWLEDAIDEYVKRVKRYVTFDYRVIPDVKNAAALSESLLKEKEGEQLLGLVGSGDEVFLFDESGKSYSSEGFADFIEKKMLQSLKSLIFVIGGAYGFSDAVYARANGKIALSQMTFSHQMVRLIATEQLYRAFSILNYEPYHHK